MIGNKIQKEHGNFLLSIKMQKRELESNIDKRSEEIKSYLRDKEKAFELEKRSELPHFASLREKVEKELENVAFKKKKLNDEKKKKSMENASQPVDDQSLFVTLVNNDQTSCFRKEET